MERIHPATFLLFVKHVDTLLLLLFVFALVPAITKSQENRMGMEHVSF